MDKADQVFPTQLADTIREKGEEGLLEKYQRSGLTRGSAGKIAGACYPGSEMLLKLQEVEMPDSIDIQLNIAHQGGNPNYHSLNELSTGQQCTAILNIILLENPDPLIMDQPEDNLDNSFIAERIIKDIRDCKDDRQFIFATHNANIPVFGDAELILVVEADAKRVKMSKEKIGSVDKPAVKEAAARHFRWWPGGLLYATTQIRVSIMMIETDILRLIANGEGPKTEFKERFERNRPEKNSARNCQPCQYAWWIYPCRCVRCRRRHRHTRFRYTKLANGHRHWPLCAIR